MKSEPTVNSLHTAPEYPKEEEEKVNDLYESPNDETVWKDPQQNTPPLKEYPNEYVTVKITNYDLTTKGEEAPKMTTKRNYNINITPAQTLKMTSPEIYSLPTVTNYNAYKLNIPDLRDYKLSGKTIKNNSAYKPRGILGYKSEGQRG